jgi:hypothetical protein
MGIEGGDRGAAYRILYNGLRHPVDRFCFGSRADWKWILETSEWPRTSRVSRITRNTFVTGGFVNVGKKAFYTLCTFVLRHLGCGTKWFCWRRSGAGWIGRSKPGSKFINAGAQCSTANWFRETTDRFHEPANSAIDCSRIKLDEPGDSWQQYESVDGESEYIYGSRNYAERIALRNFAGQRLDAGCWI